MLAKFVFLRIPIAKKMAYLHSQDRFQIQMRSMEELIDKDNPVRFIDAFVDHLDLSQKVAPHLNEPLYTRTVRTVV